MMDAPTGAWKRRYVTHSGVFGHVGSGMYMPYYSIHMPFVT